MSINLIQFQQGLSMVEFMQQYGTEANAYRALYRARWPHGFRCPARDDRRRLRFRRGRQVCYQCRSCRHQMTLLSGTIFEATKLPLRTWLLAIHLLTATKTTNGSPQGTNMAALELKRPLGVDLRPTGVHKGQGGLAHQARPTEATKGQGDAGDGRARSAAPAFGIRADR